jgi:hypothetical protein
LVEFKNPDYVAYAKSCGADGYRAETLKNSPTPSSALASGRPTLIDAAITRLALPHYSTSPEGVVAGIAERIRDRFGDPSREGILGGIWDSIRRRSAMSSVTHRTKHPGLADLLSRPLIETMWRRRRIA